ncbi:MAG: hypothetical protein ACO4B3_06645 [Planctomycetota bacterium]
MSEAIDASRGDYDDPLATPPYILGLVGTVILIATVVLVHTLSNNTGQSMQDEALERDYFEIQQVRARQQEQLSSTVWTIQEEDRASIPIQQGMERVIEQYGNGN